MKLIWKPKSEIQLVGGFNHYNKYRNNNQFYK